MFDFIAMAGCIGALVAAGGVWAYLSSAPAADAHGAVADLRRTIAVKAAVRGAFCKVHRDVAAETDGYCSDACRDQDAEMQAIA